MYCCCDKKIKQGWKCVCDWEGWNSKYDYPPERKNRDREFSSPKVSGIYLVRYSKGSGDRIETEAYFSLDAIKKVMVGYFSPQKEYEIHWDCDDGEEGHPYAWREL